MRAIFHDVHEPIFYGPNRRVVCTCGDFNCASLDDGRQPRPERCVPHDLLPGQCECTWVADEPDYELARTIVQRDFGWVDEAPQVSATVVCTPTTDRLVKRLGHDIPTIGYGHWAVQVDDRATRDLQREREAARAAAERQALIDAMMAAPNLIGASLTIH